MFGKSLKYEFRAIARKVLPLFLTILAVSVIIGVAVILDGRVFAPAESTAPSTLREILYFAQSILLIGLLILIFVAGVTVLIMTIKRFYTSFFTDEGYLTFTLPVTMNCHLMTKIVSMLIWNLFGGLVTAVAYLILLGGMEIGYGAVTEAYAVLADDLREMGRALSVIWDEYTGSVILAAIYGLLFYIFEILLVYFGISIGCMLTKRHRVIVSILCIIGVNVVFSILDSILMSILSLAAFPDSVASSFAVLLSLTVFCLVKGMACYLGTKAILIKRLNLD